MTDQKKDTRVGPDLCIALDFNSGEKAKDFAKQLVTGVSDQLGSHQLQRLVFKVGLELFITEGPEVVRSIHALGSRIFLDLKLHDIPETVRKSVRTACLLPIDFLTLHLQGGEFMVKGALEEIVSAKSKLRLLGVSVLTSFSEDQWKKTANAYGFEGEVPSPSQSVKTVVEKAVSWGMKGFVCSPADLEAMRSASLMEKADLYWMTPGIRPKTSNPGDQARVVTPAEASRLGSSGIVVGRPITEARDPVAAACEILKEMSKIG